MSLTDLRKLDLLRPEEEWSGRTPRSTVHVSLAGVAAAMGLGSCVLMALGDGGVPTWIGIAVFSVALVAFTIVNVRAIGVPSDTEPADESESVD